MGGFLWIKALHVIAVISWMAGLLYLPRLFVYHSIQSPGSASSEMLKVMEARLLRFIMTPAMIVVWLSGLHMVFVASYWMQTWFLVKFLFVLALSGFHEFLRKETADFQQDRRARSQTFYRIVNEVPTLLMIFIVVLVVVRPF